MIQRVLPEVHDGQRRRFVFRLIVVKKRKHII
jgi:hypothetical protein